MTATASPHPAPEPTSAHGRGLQLARTLAVPLGVMVSGALVWQSSFAAFTATTTNPGNAWSTGTVTLTDNDSDVAMFSTADATGGNMVPGAPSERCIKVTYGGSVASTVKMYATGVSGTGPEWFKLKIEEGTVGEATGGSCTDFGGTTRVLYGNDAVDTETLQAFGTASSSFATGVDATTPWAPTAAAQFRTYRITVTVIDNNTAQNKTAAAAFTWEAQSASS